MEAEGVVSPEMDDKMKCDRDAVQETARGGPEAAAAGMVDPRELPRAASEEEIGKGLGKAMETGEALDNEKAIQYRRLEGKGEMGKAGRKEVMFAEQGFESSDDTTPNGMTTPSVGSVSSFDSNLSESDGTRPPRSQSMLLRKRAGGQPKKRLTAEERKMFMRIEQEWREEDAWAHEPAGTLSTLFWTPILIGLRCFDIWLTVVTYPFVLVARLLFGFEMNRSSFWDVPLERRKQTIAVFGFVILLPMVAVATVWGLLLLIFPLTTIPMACYWAYILYFDKGAITGQRRPFIRYWRMWRHFANYFPLRLIKTATLDPNRKYVFAYHPHGIISVGAFGNFATNATGFSRKFPGIDLRLLTLSMNFYCPWLREILLWMGLCSASRESCDNILGKGPGSAIMLVVGGAAESLETEPGTYRLMLGRQGFVRVALDNGADLVPVLGFGENDIFDTAYQAPNTTARRLQEFARKKIGFATPLFWGRGLFSYSFGILPHRKPIIVVVGKPIKLPKLPPHLKGAALCTTKEGRQIVDDVHNQYVAALRALWTQYRDRWAIHRAGSLLIQGMDRNPKRK